MPQIKRNCQHLISDPAYMNLFNILTKWEKPEFAVKKRLQAIAYNCAIRKVALDYQLYCNTPINEEPDDEDNELPNGTESLKKEPTQNAFFYIHQDTIMCDSLAEYGLDTFLKTVTVPEPYDTTHFIYSPEKLYWDYPFIRDDIRTKLIHSEKTTSYPPVQKPLSKERICELRKLFDNSIEQQEALVMPTNKEPELNFKIDSIFLKPLYTVQAFYYFDCITFYGNTKSMLERTYSHPNDAKIGNDNRKINNFLCQISPYIQEKEYFNFI